MSNRRTKISRWLQEYERCVSAAKIYSLRRPQCARRVEKRTLKLTSSLSSWECQYVVVVVFILVCFFFHEKVPPLPTFILILEMHE